MSINLQFLLKSGTRTQVKPHSLILLIGNLINIMPITRRIQLQLFVKGSLKVTLCELKQTLKMAKNWLELFYDCVNCAEMHEA